MERSIFKGIIKAEFVQLFREELYAYKATPKTSGLGIGLAQLQPNISYFPVCFGYQMKATSVIEYQNKFQPDMSLFTENAWTGRKQRRIMRNR
jgi:hypothetical protein